ncbi:TIGR04338 family metallohydrolase [Nocardia flavorosea]|uniref:TIGR04338 family metallohydrolase n=1 Tax=Nocardia flavorosea TaxID=53429 RepID=A0A846YRG4_9NOCA|nr:TIGR04338 family metallohydrolase [Nocardia flavorosea]NKY60281.1 TIGR04338 family metallohydrolase [Nocardia flavorosea]
MSTLRDSQRAKVYDAEQLVRAVFDRADEFGRRTVEVHGSRLTLPAERKFASVESVQEYCDRVFRLNWVAAEWERAATPIRVRARAGTVAAHYESGRDVLAVPVHGSSSRRGGGPWALRELVILHEIAHHLESRPDAVAPHGPEFCGRYVDLVEGVLGPEAGLLLRITFYDSGVSLT